jgi:hypothetical protein
MGDQALLSADDFGELVVEARIERSPLLWVVEVADMASVPVMRLVGIQPPGNA